MQADHSKALYSYWNALRGARSTPDRRDIDPTKIRSALANTFILEANEGEEFAFRLAGSHLCSAYCRELKGRSFSSLWHEKDHEALNTLIRAVTEDHAVALVSFAGTTALGTRCSFEVILMPLRHNGLTNNRIFGGLTALEQPYWLGVQPIKEQRITGLRLIWPDDLAQTPDLEAPAAAASDLSWASTGTNPGGTGLSALPTQLYGNSARRYAHLAVIDGGRS